MHLANAGYAVSTHSGGVYARPMEMRRSARQLVTREAARITSASRYVLASLLNVISGNQRQ